MKFPFRCKKCTALNPAEYRGDNHYRFECKACGQTNLATLRKALFEILFDFGSWAFLDGYYREAVANFATSLERFFEFWLRAIRHKRGLGDDRFDETWNLLSRQSERQMGAFAMLYLFETGKSPGFLDPNLLKARFRNDVVHAGKIPTRGETVEYANLVHDLIRRLLIELHDIAPDHVTMDLENKTAEVLNRAHNEGHAFLDFAYDGMFGINRFSPEKRSEAQQTYQATQAGGPPSLTGSHEYLRIDLSFEETLEARKWFLKKQFHKG